MNANNIVGGFIIFIILCIALYKSIKHRECFATKYILADNHKNVKDSVRYDKELIHQMILTVKRKGYIDIFTLKSLGMSVYSNVDIYIDPYIDYFIFANRTDAEYEDGIFLCLTPKKLESSDCVWNMEGKTIAYSYISDYLFLQAVVKAYRQDMKKIKIIKINDYDLQISEQSAFDMMFTYAVINSDYMKMIARSRYYINGLNDVDINRIKVFYPFVNENFKNMREYFADEMIKTYVNEKPNALIPIMRYKIIPLRVLTTRKETFITRFESDKTEMNGKKFTCETNEDCPYYKANVNYPNTRGGCLKGFCELPVGVKKSSYTDYDDTGINSALCYDCKDTTDWECCRKQDKPDYVFSDDMKDRTQYNMQTVINTLDIDGF